jgi:hypothetical protein
MAFFTAKVGEETYELDKLTLGDARLLKKQFGLVDMTEFSGTDPDQLVGLMFLAYKKANPGLTDETVLSHVESLDIEAFVTGEPDTAEAETAVDPTPAPTDAVADPDPSAPSGLRETTPEDSGDQN